MIHKTWLSEVMGQDVKSSNGKDFTRLVFNYFILDNDLFDGKKVRIEELYIFIYRFYADNVDFAKINPSPIIKNILNYKPNDLSEYIKEELFIWCNREKHSILKYSKDFVWLNEIIGNSDEFIKKYNIIIKIMFKKYFDKDNFDYSLNESELVIKGIQNCNDDEKYLQIMKGSKLRNRFFEIINFCPLCDEYNKDRLNIVHIKEFSKCNDEELRDIDNTLMLCEEHCKMYLKKEFSLNLKGYIVFSSNLNNLLDKRMHLNIELLSDKRKEYIKNSAVIHEEI